MLLTTGVNLMVKEMLWNAKKSIEIGLCLVKDISRIYWMISIIIFYFVTNYTEFGPKIQIKRTINGLLKLISEEIK